MARVAEGPGRMMGGVDCTATSSYARTRRGAGMLRAASGGGVKPVVQVVADLKSGAGPEGITDGLAGQEPAATILLAGHEPDLSILMGYLTTSNVTSYAGSAGQLCG